MAASTAAQASDFVQRVMLPDPQRARGSEIAGLAQPAFDASKDESLVVGSGIVSFKTGIAGDRRRAVTDSLLLAQLVVKKRGIAPEDAQNWYHEYASVLANLGWLVETSEMTEFVSQEDGLDVHEAIMAVAALLLGPAAIAAAPLIDATLKALHSMDTNTPWITLFNRESRRAKAASFQIALAEPAANGDLSVSMMAFSIDANMDITQVLFFKVHRNQASLKRVSTTAQINLSVLDSVQSDLQKKVAAFTSSYISQLPDLI